MSCGSPSCCLDHSIIFQLFEVYCEITEFVILQGRYACCRLTTQCSFILYVSVMVGRCFYSSVESTGLQYQRAMPRQPSKVINLDHVHSGIPTIS